MQPSNFSEIHEDDEDELHLPALVYWASLGDVEHVKQLLDEGEDPNQADEEGYSALHAAAENDHLDTVKLLIQHGGTDSELGQYTALQLAEMADNAEVIEFLKTL